MTDKKTYKSLIDIKKYIRKAIYPSELYLFWQEAKKLDIDTIVESGTYLGFTTKRLAALFPKCKIITYECREERCKIARKNCGPDIEVVCGKLDVSRLTAKTALLIDGPKWMEAVELATSVMDKVAIIGIHDMYKYIKELKQRFKYVVHSGNSEKEIRKLDKYVPGETIKRNNRDGYYGTVLACVRNT